MSQSLQDLCSLAGELGEQELDILYQVAVRLRQGQEAFGLFDLERDGRDWVQMAVEEAADQSVYLLANLIRLKLIRDVLSTKR